MMQRKKHAVRNYLAEDPTPQPGQIIARVLVPRGNHLHEVKFPDGTVTLAELPTKFRSIIWVKRDSYVLSTRSPLTPSRASQRARLAAKSCTCCSRNTSTRCARPASGRPCGMRSIRVNRHRLHRQRTKRMQRWKTRIEMSLGTTAIRVSFGIPTSRCGQWIVVARRRMTRKMSFHERVHFRTM
ncbi:hypothetical protein BCR44DRAFT_1103708 [Catenaria anguillulae PL171]|uniref:S1-like domain-containing protein n=1 Tax=Catenaria anguillulae PL171 TaxID=765915 RepID=A0A1Y2I4Q0_9FUNG|nr:hypothetical protein BCR44DRAFT_1103708 [Catenaria anguillulae PL171]